MVPSALAAAECARRLSSLEISMCGLDSVGEIASLGVAIGAGRFPALARLGFYYNHGPDACSIKALVEAFTPAHAPPLEAFHVSVDTLKDADVIAVAAALRDGSLGSGLRELRISYYVPEITQTGATALADALAAAGGQRVQRLEELTLMAPSLSADETRAVLERALAACPRLTLVQLSSRTLSAADKGSLAAVMKEKRGSRGRVTFDIAW